MSMQGDKGVRGDRVRYKYKCEKLPSWDTAKGGHEDSFLQWYVLQGREASRKVCVQRG